ncbi:hypothetical protein TTHERM_00771970 (macronuclear) [Tetrahymena thermophila SB210]|uniref:Uncharacterized protein n=1 Tax=Tetrahymena thermophila (strain SB210) TaxID=312017 RepID=Q23AQ1_TETTS|nr:hypothetical protein TTHERM_00771970 [Tetrahymena thermophila SB210]EAR93641.2 hypothetical protein TTHERM_00771970 [Tetrahymena thermophila SB210]|eukprot:XP_001013886.2 hypothetical protein TTHERM_00771970 [Tetrahymena thermophila SB210]
MIQDKYDPSGQGMFSKSGRQSGDARTMLERVINSQTTKNKKKESFLANQNPYSNLFDEIEALTKESQLNRPNTANIQNQRSYFHDYQITIKEKIDTANKMEPFQKQISREQYNRPFSQKQEVRSKKKGGFIYVNPDPLKKRPQLVWDILKVYKTQQKFKQQTQQNILASQCQQQQQSTINQARQSVMQNNSKEQAATLDQSMVLTRSFLQSPSKRSKEQQKTPNNQKTPIKINTQQSFCKSYLDKSYDQVNQQSHSQSPEKANNEIIAYPERVKRKVSGFIDFKRQLNRSKDSYDKFYKVNEKRFEYLNESQVSSKVKHLRDLSFNKQLNREVVSTFKPVEKIPDNGYQPNFEVTKKSLGRVGPNFSKISPHKSLENKLVGVYQGVHYEYDQWVKNPNKKSIVYKNNKLNIIPFEKQLPREQCPNHALPGYMQNVRSRISLQDLSQKMLEENSYMDQKFLNMNSVFSTKSSMSRQSTKSITQQNFFISGQMVKSPSQKERRQTANSSCKNGRNFQRNGSFVSAQITNHSFYY